MKRITKEIQQKMNAKSSLIPEKWEEVSVEMNHIPFDDLCDDRVILEETWYASQIRERFEQAFKKDGLINYIPFKRERIYSSFFLRYSLYLAYGVRNVGLYCKESSDSHIVIRPNGDFGFCKESSTGNGFECYKRGYIEGPCIWQYAEDNSGICSDDDRENIHDMFLEMVETPSCFASRTIFDVIRWVWKETDINAKFTVDGNWMQIDIIPENVFDNDINDITSPNSPSNENKSN